MPSIDVGGQCSGVQRGHVVLGCAVRDAKEVQGLAAQVVAQQASGDKSVIGLLLDKCARGNNQRGAEFRLAYPVIEVFQGLIEDFCFTDV